MLTTYRLSIVVLSLAGFGINVALIGPLVRYRRLVGHLGLALSYVLLGAASPGITALRRLSDVNSGTPLTVFDFLVWAPTLVSITGGLLGWRVLGAAIGRTPPT